MGIKYDKKEKKVKIRDMHGNKDKPRDEPGWLCRCQRCDNLGYVTIGDAVPEYCEPCYEELNA